MKKHKPPFVAKLEFIDEDKYNEFMGLIYLLKKNLTINKIERTRPFYLSVFKVGEDVVGVRSKDKKLVDYDPSLDNDRPDGPQDYERGIDDYEYYHEITKPWLKLLAKLAGNFYISSLDKDKMDNSSEIPTMGGKVPHLEIYSGSEDFNTLFHFLAIGVNKDIPTILDKHEIEQLVYYILYMGNERFKISREIADDFYFATVDVLDRIVDLPIELYSLLGIDTSLGLSKKANITYHDKLSHNESYLLFFEIYFKVKCDLHELFPLKIEKISDNQFKIIVGLILSFVGLKGKKRILTEDEYMNKESKTKIKSYRKYLDDNMRNWMKKSQEKYPERWEELEYLEERSFKIDLDENPI